MVLTVSGLRCIQHAALEIPPGLARVRGGNGSGKTSPLKVMFLPGWGRSFLMRDSRRRIQPGQDHLGVIVRRWPFRASRAWASRPPWDGRVWRIRAQRRSHNPPVRVG